MNGRCTGGEVNSRHHHQTLSHWTDIGLGDLVVQLRIAVIVQLDCSVLLLVVESGRVMSVGDSTGRKILPHNAMQFVSVLERCRRREYWKEGTGFDQVPGWTSSEFRRPHIIGYAIRRQCLFRILADCDRNRMNVGVLTDSFIEVQIRTHEDAGCTNGSSGKDDPFRGLND